MNIDFVAFERGRGGPGPKMRVEDLCARWNVELAKARKDILISPGFRGTGNYLIQSQQALSVEDLTSLLNMTLSRPGEPRFAVFATREFQEWLSRILGELGPAPEVPTNRKPNKGAVMALDPDRGVPGPLPAPNPTLDPVRDGHAWTSGMFAAHRVRGAWKNDLLQPDGKLDKTFPGREGTWGALAKSMERKYGGKWTARAASTLLGMCAKIEALQQTAPASGPVCIADLPPCVDRIDDESVTQLRQAISGTAIEKVFLSFFDVCAKGEVVQAMAQARRIGETLARRICKAADPTELQTFLGCCREIVRQRLLSERSAVYLNALRKLGNFAVHEAERDDLGPTDLKIVGWMLAEIVREGRSRGHW